MNIKKKVLFFLPSSTGGAERVTLTIAKMLSQNDYDVTIVIVSKSKGDIVKFVPVYMNIKLIHVVNIWDFGTLKIFRLLRHERPYAVFCSFIYLNNRVALAARMVGNIKIIIRSPNMIQVMHWSTIFLLKKTIKYVDMFIMQTDEMREQYQALLPKFKNRIRTIPNPIDLLTIKEMTLNARSPYKTNKFNYVFVGRICHAKGIDVLLKSFEMLNPSLNNFHLTIIGNCQDKHYYKILTDFVDEHSLKDVVTFEGFKSNPYTYIKYANCLVLPSRIEGLPNVILEAMYLQTPVIATRCVPVVDRMVNKDRGIVIDVEDVKGLTDAMNEIRNLKIMNTYHYDGAEQFIELFE